MSPLDRIMARVVVTDAGCWQWTGPTTHNGYARVSVDGRNAMVHRVTYEHHVGPIPDGLDLDHLCRNRTCCNPDHLEPVTRRENLLRGDTVNARHATATHCKHGHAFTIENTMIVTRPDGSIRQRRCRACRRLRSQTGAAARSPSILRSVRGRSIRSPNVLATADGSHPSLPAPPCGSVRSSARPGSAASAAALPGGGPEFFGCSSAEVERIRRVFARTRPL